MTLPRSVPEDSWVLTRWVFLRALAIVFFIAFLSLRAQIDGLIGSQGVEPAARHLTDTLRQYGWSAYLRVPSLAWIASTDGFLHVLCDAGVLLSVMLFVGIAEGPAVVMLWGCYLSFVTIGGFFLDWMCDDMLLEVAFFSFFLSPLRWRSAGYAPSRLAVFLMQCFLFRFMLMCGLTKLFSPDPAWRHLSAIHFQLVTQPNPSLITWYANLLPEWMKEIATAIVVIVELLVPLMIFAGRRWRRWSFVLLAGVQMGIALSGNYAWFNWLTIAVALFTLDDDVWRRILPPSWHGVGTGAPAAEPTRLRVAAGARPLAALLVVFAACHSIRPIYSAFSRVERERHELVLEGSNDGVTWIPYEFRWKPGRVDRVPGSCEPHQPRLDWAMCEAPRKWIESRRWLAELVDRLLEGSPAVVALFDGNPFPSAPPRMVRGRLFRYRYTTPQARARTGAWWKRRFVGVVLPAVARVPG